MDLFFAATSFDPLQNLLGFDPIKFQNETAAQQLKASKALDAIWTHVIGGGAWTGMSQMGAFIAVFTLAFFMFYLMKSWTSSEYDTPISELVWPLIVALLLAGNGKFAGEMALGLRGVINIQIQNVQRSMADTDAVKAKMTEVATTRAGLEKINAEFEQCKTTNDSVKYTACMTRLKQTINDEQIKTPGVQLLKNLGREVDGAIANVQAAVADPGEAISKGVVAVGVKVTKIVGFPLLLSLKPLISGLAYLYQWLMELAMLATALLLPVALAVSLMPEHKAIFAWLTAMLSIANAKLCYTVIVAWGAEAMLTDPSQDFVFLMLTGIGAPFFSLILASGGGLAMYSAMVDVLSVAASAGVQAVGAGVKMLIPAP